MLNLMVGGQSPDHRDWDNDGSILDPGDGLGGTDILVTEAGSGVTGSQDITGEAIVDLSEPGQRVVIAKNLLKDAGYAWEGDKG